MYILFFILNILYTINMSLACYVHIPYCIQKCSYCDFTVFTPDKLPPTHVYISWLKKEIDMRHNSLKNKTLRSIYLGGGTPSIIPAKQLISIIEHLKKYFSFHPNIEITIEINPGTITKSTLDIYLLGGINRFSVGVQTFQDDILKLFNREHSSQQTQQTLELLATHKVVFSTDLLWAINHQKIHDLKKDLDIILSYSPQHVSAYYLTLPSHHKLQKNRPPETIQLKMFHEIESCLKKNNFDHYEISNFAKKGFHSKHNMTYWLDKNYWGIGLSSHSFLKINNKRVRFWNPKKLSLYSKQIENKSTDYPFSALPITQQETLTINEALTDFCHTALRTRWGIQQEKLKTTFGYDIAQLVLNKLKILQKKNWIKKEGNRWSLPTSAWIISNYIFQEMTFLPEDLKLTMDNNNKT